MGRALITPRKLRRRSTAAERKAWGILRDRRLLGLKFRRQHRIGRYIVDFYCAELRLVVEVDGGYHETPEQHARDVARAAALESRGIHVLRVRNSLVTEAGLMDLICPFVPPSPQLRRGGPGG